MHACMQACMHASMYACNRVCIQHACMHEHVRASRKACYAWHASCTYMRNFSRKMGDKSHRLHAHATGMLSGDHSTVLHEPRHLSSRVIAYQVELQSQPNTCGMECKGCDRSDIALHEQSLGILDRPLLVRLTETCNENCYDIVRCR